MLKSDVLKYFGTAAKAGRAAGVTKSAASQWGELIPELMARRLHDATGGALPFDPSLYQKGAPPEGDLARESAA
jgi:hypothetical protein